MLTLKQKRKFYKNRSFWPLFGIGRRGKKGRHPGFLSLDDLNLNQALKLLELPKVLGLHPKTKKEVKKSIGRYGPYIVHEGDFRSVPPIRIFFSLELKEALKILSQEKKGKKRSEKKALKEFKHNKEIIKILEGYSPYIRFKNKNYSLPKGISP